MKGRLDMFVLEKEKKDCHLYEKLGYVQKGIIQEVNKDMHFVLYVK